MVKKINLKHQTKTKNTVENLLDLGYLGKINTRLQCPDCHLK